MARRKRKEIGGYEAAFIAVVVDRQRALRLPIQDLAQQARMTREELVAFLDGKHDPPLGKLRLLAKALNLQLVTLLRKVEARGAASHRFSERFPEISSLKPHFRFRGRRARGCAGGY